MSSQGVKNRGQQYPRYNSYAWKHVYLLFEYHARIENDSS